jgi:hypothetical protein
LRIALTVRNAGYGAVGNESFLYYRVENAEAITMAGQLINKWTAKRLVGLLQSFSNNKEKQYIIAGDTDSVYVSLSDIVDILIPNWKELDIDVVIDKIDEFIRVVLDPEIEQYCLDLVDYMQAYKQKMVWEREIIANCMHPQSLINGVSVEDLYNSASRLSDDDNVRKLVIDTTSVSLITGTLENSKSDYITRRYYSGDLIHIELCDGSMLSLTPEHKVFCRDSNNNIFQKCAGDLTFDDDIITQEFI